MAMKHPPPMSPQTTMSSSGLRFLCGGTSGRLTIFDELPGAPDWRRIGDDPDNRGERGGCCEGFFSTRELETIDTPADAGAARLIRAQLFDATRFKTRRIQYAPPNPAKQS